MIPSGNTRIGNLSRRGGRTDVAPSPQRPEQGAMETEHNRPSSSGGRLEQHLGDVESVDKSSVTDIEPSSPTIPIGVGLLGASRVTNEFGCVGTGRGDVDRIATPSGKPCAVRGGNVAGSVSSHTRTVDHQPPLRRASDAVQLTTGRRDRDRMGRGRRRSLAFVGGPFVGTNIENLSKKGFPRPKREDTKTSRRAASQVSFAPPAVEGIGDGVGEGCKDNESKKGRRQSEDETEDHKFRMHAGQSNILVSVRLRPLLKHDRDHVEVVKVLGNKMVVLLDPAKLNQDVDPLRVNRTREKRYAFDYVFDGTATQRVVYENTTKFLIQGVLDGFNATVFAYGCTGAGKTYTMIGSDHEGHQGIMVLTLQDLFDQQRRRVGLSFQDGMKPFHYDSAPSSIAVLDADGGDDAQASEAQGRRYSVTVSFLEVYNENIRDLLNDTGEFLDLREDPIKGPITSGLAEVEVRTPEEIMGILHQGNLNRTQQATRANAVSSRSHAILQVVVESRDKAPGTVAAVHVGKLSLVDLAGSERAAATQNRGVRLVEGANINRSLLALGNCINALGERSNKGQFVPYRDSKLTRLLKDSLGGNCRTVMIANISGAASSFEETLNTLKYANRAKNIKTNATRNSLDVNHHITEYVNLIGSLRSEITRLKHQLLRSGRGHRGAGNDRPEPAVVFTLSRKMRTNSLFPAADQDKPTHMDGSNEEEVEAGKKRNGVRQRRKGGREDTFLFGDDDRDAGAIASPSQAEQSLVERTGARAEIVTTTSASSAEKMSGSTSLETGITADDAVISSMLATDARATSSRDRDFVEEVRERIVENFRERMQLRRSLIELEDQNVQNSIEIGKRQLLLVEWHGGRHLPQEAASDALKGFAKHGEWAKAVAAAAEAARRDGEENADEETPAPSPEVRMAWRECEQLNSAILRNNETKRKISRRLKNNSRQAERFKADLDGKITGEDRNQLMKLQYRIGKLELDNMELEQNRIVHESAMREKDLTIQKLQLQLALRDRIAVLQQSVLQRHGIEACLECPGVVSGNSVNQGGITDALDALLLEEGFHIGSEKRGAGDDNGRADYEQIDAIDTDRGADRLIARGRRGGWGSPPPQDKDDRSVKLVRAASDTNVAVMDSCDSDGRTDRGSVSNSPLRAPLKTSIVTSSITIADKEDGGMHHLVGRVKQAFPGKADDDGNGDGVESRRGRRTTVKSLRTGELKAARTRSTQPLPPTLRSRPQETRPPQIHRVPTGAAGVAVVDQRLGNRDKGSFDEGLVISSIPCEYAERNCTRAALGDVNGGSTLTQEVPPTSVEVAPFHGLVPASPLASSSSNVNNDALGGRTPSIVFNPTADERTLCQDDDSLLDTVSVVGVSLKQQAPNKRFHQRVRPTAGGNDRWRRPQGNALGAKEVTSTVPISTWDEVEGRRDRCREGARKDSDQDVSDDIEDSAIMPPGAGEPIAAAVRDGGRDRRGRPGFSHYNPSSEQPDGSSSQEPSGSTVTRKSHGHKVLPFEVEAASSGKANKGGGGIFRMGISGKSVKFLPWGERREGSTALVAAARSGPDRGATHQRTRREKVSKASEPGNRSGECNHAGDGGGGGD